MKAIKYILFSALVSAATLSFAGSDETKQQIKAEQKVIELQFEQIYYIPGLVEVMQRRLDGSFLSVNQQTYTVDVEHWHAIFRITGTYDQWVSFFWPKWLPLPGGKVNYKVIKKVDLR
jgi:hypothetical protein